ncbi:MAG: DNA-binding response regulator [Chloroflexi bacterium]|nr:MAG: DNA-binding response regulator [Chloroflexota bacterium]
MRVLTVINDPQIEKAVILCFQLYFPEAALVSAAEGARAIEALVMQSPDVVVLDLVPPDMDGFDLLSRLRALSDVPVIVVTPRGEELERVRGLELGADDYIYEPFSSAELVARIRAVLRRTVLRTGHPSPPTTVPQLALDRDRGFTVRGQQVPLSPVEHRLLRRLARSAGQVVSHSQLMADLWGEDYLGSSSRLRVHIHRLRLKLGDSLHNPRLIITVPGQGYRLNLPGG